MVCGVVQYCSHCRFGLRNLSSTVRLFNSVPCGRCFTHFSSFLFRIYSTVMWEPKPEYLAARLFGLMGETESRLSYSAYYLVVNIFIPFEHVTCFREHSTRWSLSAGLGGTFPNLSKLFRLQRVFVRLSSVAQCSGSRLWVLYKILIVFEKMKRCIAKHRQCCCIFAQHQFFSSM